VLGQLRILQGTRLIILINVFKIMRGFLMSEQHFRVKERERERKKERNVVQNEIKKTTSKIKGRNLIKRQVGL
jgi:hypothetical protein